MRTYDGRSTVLKKIYSKGTSTFWTGLVRLLMTAMAASLLVPTAHGANKKFHAEQSLLMMAVLSNDAHNVAETLSKGANAEMPDELGRTPLIWASREGYFDVAKILLEVGANPGAKDKNGWTPLAMAISQGHREIVELLLREGANPEAEDKYGISAMELADYRKMDLQSLIDDNPRAQTGTELLAAGNSITP